MMPLNPAEITAKKACGEWRPYRWFPWVEYRVCFHTLLERHIVIDSRKRTNWRWRQPKPAPIPEPVTLPPKLLFDWQRDYGPLWEPGSKAFWLAPEPGDLPAGKWPLPYIKEGPAPELKSPTHYWKNGIINCNISSSQYGIVHFYMDESGKIMDSDIT